MTQQADDEEDGGNDGDDDDGDIDQGELLIGLDWADDRLHF